MTSLTWGGVQEVSNIAYVIYEQPLITVGLQIEWYEYPPNLHIYFKNRMELFAKTVPANNTLFAGSVLEIILHIIRGTTNQT